MLILSAQMHLASKQVDYTNAFCQASQAAELYIDLPPLYKVSGREHEALVLSLKKTLHGQADSPRRFWLHLKEGLTKIGFVPSESDQCLFVHRSLKCMVLCYVDDCVWLAEDGQTIDDCVKKLRDLGHLLTIDEDSDLFSFLGISIKKDNNQIHMTQKGLTDKVLRHTGMENATPKDTPAALEPVGTDPDGDPFDEKWNYAAAVGMLLYLSSNTRPDIQHAVHSAARFTHAPRKSHGQAVKRICRHLLATRNGGITFTPDTNAGLDCYVDADFCGLHSCEDHQDPISVKSRTGYVLTLFGCPVLWASKLQSEITLSTVAAEYVAFSMAMRELLPMRALLTEIGIVMGLEVTKGNSLVRSTVFDDSTGCLSLGNVPKMSPRNKHLALKHHFFRENIGEDKGIVAKHVNTKQQKADTFTKFLPRDAFQSIRKLLIGWQDCHQLTD